jgi:hypothetical protein
MSERGKFYERLSELQYVEDSSIVGSYEMENLFDEAKKEYPEHHTEGFEELLNLLEDKNDWFKKWFGEAKP